MGRQIQEFVNAVRIILPKDWTLSTEVIDYSHYAIVLRHKNEDVFQGKRLFVQEMKHITDKDTGFSEWVKSEL